MEGKILHYSRWLTTAVCLIVLLTMPGCIGFFAQLGNVIYGNKVKAAYDGLEGKRVAIVCVSEESAYGPDTASRLLANAIRVHLLQQDLEIDMVRESEIENWLDSNWEEIDYVEIGKAVNADRVVAVDLESYSLHEGTTLFKGRCSYVVSVFDMEKGGLRVFNRGPLDYEFPKTHGHSTTSVSERHFQSYFIHELAAEIARDYYDYDFPDTVASDPAHLGN